MKLIFFQNCVSPHQIPYIKELALNLEVQEVVLVVPRYDYQERKDMGWNNKGLLAGTHIDLLYKPDIEAVKGLFCNNENSYCFFSGIRADSDVFSWFNESLNHNVKRYIITEPPYTFDKPLWMHYVRFFLQDYKFVKHIDGIFGIGQDAVRYYKNISSRWKVFPFQYVTAHNERVKDVPQGKLKLLFVGSLCKRKNVKVVIEALKGLDDIEFTIVGDGEERRQLEELANKNNISATFLGTKGIDEIPAIMQEHDVLVLPSLHDGWGAVVNEAMDLGLYAITSDRCGARMMIRKGCTGDVFRSDNSKSLRECLKRSIENKDIIRNNIHNNIDKFDKYRSKNVAKYFKDCLI